jgi:predicted nucleotidyltransferase component of viral defense system
MQEAISRMMARYETQTVDEAVRALREILQEIALLGLWRAKFFEHAAFYGGTALRILYGLDRFSEDLDFTLLEPKADFDLGRFTDSLQQEVMAFGFDVQVTLKQKSIQTAVQSAFLKGNTRNQLITIETPSDTISGIHRDQIIKIKIEVDTDPPLGFATGTQYLLQPIQFPVKVCDLPDLFAGKMHAVLFRRWKNRVKGRDWYDFVWFITNHPKLHMSYLEKRMRQTGDWQESASLTPQDFAKILASTIDNLDVEKARKEVLPFLRNKDTVALWSRDFFHSITKRIQFI